MRQAEKQEGPLRAATCPSLLPDVHGSIAVSARMTAHQGGMAPGSVAWRRAPIRF